MSGKSRRGKARHQRRRDDRMAEYRAYAKNPLYAEYGRQVMTLVEKGIERDLQDELLEGCSPAALITAMLELSDYRCASWKEGCTMHVPKLDRQPGSEGVEVSLDVAGACPMRKPSMCLKDMLLRLGYAESLPVGLN